MVSGAQDILEPPGEPGPVIADNNDPVVQEGEQLGSGVGDEKRGDHVEEAVVRVTDTKDIAVHTGTTHGAQPDTGSPVPVPRVMVPSSSLIHEPGDETQTLPIPSKKVSPVLESDIQPPSREPDAPGPNLQDVNIKDVQPIPSTNDGQRLSQPEGPGNPLESAQALETEPGTVDHQDFHEAPRTENQSRAHPKVLVGDASSHQAPHIDSDKPFERDKDEEPKSVNISQVNAHQDVVPEQSGADCPFEDLANSGMQDSEQLAEPDTEEKCALDPVDEVIDDIHTPSTADKATEIPGSETPAQLDVVYEDRPIPSAELVNTDGIALQDQTPSMVDGLSSQDRHQAAQDQMDLPALGCADSSTQTDELWRPITSAPRGTAPGIVLSNLHDEQAKGMSRARSMRKRVRRSSRQAEETVAAAVNIRAAKDNVGETSTAKAAVVKDLKQHGEATAPSNLPVDRRGTGVAVINTPSGSAANSITGKEPSKADDRVPRPPRAHRSSHSSRSDRPSTRDGPGKESGARSSHHHHSSRTDGERESEPSSPRTLTRRDTAESSAQGSHSSRSRRERTPQQQADHDRRKEERRLAREQEKEREKAGLESVATEAKGKDAESPVATADHSHKSSRRHSVSRNVADPSAPPVKRFFTGESVLESHFGGPPTADIAPSAIKDKEIAMSSRRSKDITRPPPAELKRSNTSRSTRVLRQSMEQSNTKSQKAQETVKPSKDKNRKRDGSSSPAPSSGTDEKKRRSDDKHRKSRMEKREKSEKEEKKKSSGGIKGMFKKLFS